MGVLRSGLSFVGGGAAMLALDAVARRGGRGGSAVRALLDRMRPAPVADDTVKAIASLPGVDSVQDLMTEPEPATAAIQRIQRSQRSPRWPLVARVVAAGTGLGAALAAIGFGGVLARPVFAVGLFVVSRAVAGVTRVPRLAPR